MDLDLLACQLLAQLLVGVQLEQELLGLGQGGVRVPDGELEGDDWRDLVYFAQDFGHGFMRVDVRDDDGALVDRVEGCI